MIMKSDQACTEPHGPCAGLSGLVRMNYFHGQLISDRDLRAEQDYFRARLRHANRCLHGYGVLCGLELGPIPGPEECRPEDDDRREKLRAAIEDYDKQNRADATEDDIRKREEEHEALVRELESLGADYPPDRAGDRHGPKHLVTLRCGAAIDCEGNDIIVRQTVKVDLDDLLGCAARDEQGQDKDAYEAPGHGDDGQATAPDSDPDPGDGIRYAYLSICYRECGREPTRPFELDECAASIRCHDARVAEGWRLTASWRRPHEDERCELCCTPCKEACLLLARIRVDRNRPVGPEDIDHSVRRRFGLYEPTVITGINWRHGFTYSLATADLMLGTNSPSGGLEIRFSRPVRADTLEKGVVDVWRIEGGKGGRAEAKSMEAQLLLPSTSNGLVDHFHINNSSRERVQRGDRILVIVRAPFILDDCCRAVEGLHLGGRAPRLPDDSEAGNAAFEEEKDAPPPEGCAHPPYGPVPWTTGGGGNFESWFYISEE